MKKMHLRMSIANFLLMLLPFSVFANNQNVVIGIGFGAGSFSTTDDLRKGSWVCTYCADVTIGGGSQVYVEWYLLDSMGIGYRGVSVSATRELYSYPLKLTETWDISNNLATVHWVFWGENDYARAGVILGVGASEYKYEASIGYGTYSSYSSASEACTASSLACVGGSTTGSASLGGIYLDWGGEDFGARVGYHSLSTSLDPIYVSSSSSTIGPYTVDGSSTFTYLDLRWAFD